MHPEKKIPPQLREHARSLADRGISGEAFPENVIRDVVRSLRGSGVAILGGDVYEEREGRLQPTYDNWHCDRLRAESFESYAERCWDQAWQYTQTYVGSPGKMPYFVLVMTDEPTAGL